MMIVVNTKTGFPQALLLDKGYLTQVRMVAAGAITAKYLAPKNVETSGVIGAGTQARYQMMGLKLVRHFKNLMIFGLYDGEIELIELGTPDRQSVPARYRYRRSLLHGYPKDALESHHGFNEFSIGQCSRVCHIAAIRCSPNRIDRKIRLYNHGRTDCCRCPG